MNGQLDIGGVTPSRYFFSIAVILVYNLPRLYRMKRFGQTLEDLAEHGLYMLEQKRWLGRVTFLGVIAFVMFSGIPQAFPSRDNRTCTRSGLRRNTVS